IIVGILASFEYVFFTGINPLMLAGSIIIGIGFIGSGLSVFRGEHPVELTTATGILVAAGVGMACGFGLYLIALVSTILALSIFGLVLPFENHIRRRFRNNSD
ncbi:MAG TPA: MgtC/SapB family protein, partial [Candidatus Paceibacterota bacterium]|nr:MgtC/SapB family protein [Candidatus Paceibacterota bacterium]